MKNAPDRRERRSDPTVALGPEPTGANRRDASRRSLLVFAGLVAMAVLAIPGVAQASTGGAASAAPPAAAPAEAETTTPTTTAFNEAELAFTPYRYAGASWYGGTGMWGRSTACGQTLTPSTVGVANKTLPCGTPVKFVWHGRSVVAPVIDRGPYVKGRAWDLTEATAEAIGFEGVGRIQYAVAIEYAAKGL